jgi:hypothetical protein
MNDQQPTQTVSEEELTDFERERYLEVIAKFADPLNNVDVEAKRNGRED